MVDAMVGRVAPSDNAVLIEEVTEVEILSNRVFKSLTLNHYPGILMTRLLR